MRVISLFRREVDENAIFWGVTHRVVLIPYRRFGTTYRSHFHGPMDFPETAVIATAHWVTSKKVAAITCRHVPACASGQTTAQWYFHFYILHQLSRLAYRFLRAFTIPESSEKGYFDREKLIIEVENIF